MKFLMTAVALLAMAGAAALMSTGAAIAADEPTPPAAGAAAEKPMTDLQKASYGIGMNIAGNLKRSGLDVDQQWLIRGLMEALADKKPAVTDAELEAAFMAVQKEVVKKQQEKAKALAEKNTKEGAEFLAANKTKEGVKTTASGLQYKIVKSGDAAGKSPKVTDMVKAHYKGTLLDGKQFDSSYDRGEPLEIPVGGVIRGWTEALQIMKPGDKWQLFIPSELAYGPQGAPPDIGPNATLVFDVELISISAPEPGPGLPPSISPKGVDPAPKGVDPAPAKP